MQWTPSQNLMLAVLACAGVSFATLIAARSKSTGSMVSNDAEALHMQAREAGASGH